MIPSISIIIPSYNVELYLEKCVKELLPQLEDNDEILLVNDGSVDNTKNIIDDLAKLDNKIVALHKENGGLSSARNLGLQYAKCDFVSFVDSDDYVDKKYLTIFRKKISIHTDVLGFGLCRVEDGIEIKNVLPILEGTFSGKQVQENVFPEILCRTSIFERNLILGSACTYFYKRKFLMINNICFKSERIFLNEDLLFNVEVFIKAKNVVFVSEKLYYYVSRNGSLTQQFHPKIYETKKNLGASIEQVISDNGLYEMFEDRIDGLWIKGIYECIVHAVWKYSQYSGLEQSKKVIHYLQDERLILALRRYPKNRLNKKGKVICFLMHHKMHSSLKFGYKLLEKIK